MKSGLFSRIASSPEKIINSPFVKSQKAKFAMIHLSFDRCFPIVHVVDPCARTGKLLTLVYAGPMFQHDLSVEVGEIVSRGGFVFADLSLSQGQIDKC